MCVENEAVSGRWYITSYPAFPGHKGAVDPDVPENGAVVGLYGSYIWARSLPDAKRKAKARGIGERVYGVIGRAMPYEPVSAQLRRKCLTPKRRLAIIHGATFLAYLASRGLKLRPWQVLGDNGFLHELVHCMAHGEPGRKETIAMVADIERRVPGYLRGRA